MVLRLALLALLLPAACAAPPEQRYLTKDQDAEVAKMCADGCAIIPSELWRQIIERNHQQGV